MFNSKVQLNLKESSKVNYISIILIKELCRLFKTLLNLTFKLIKRTAVYSALLSP